MHQQTTPAIVPPHVNTPAQTWEQEKATREYVRNRTAQMQAQTDRMYNVQPPAQGVDALKQERDQMHRTQEIQPQQPIQAPAQPPSGNRGGSGYLAFIFEGVAVLGILGLFGLARYERKKQGGKKS